MWPVVEEGELPPDTVLLACVDPTLFGNFMDEYREVILLDPVQ